MTLTSATVPIVPVAPRRRPDDGRPRRVLDGLSVALAGVAWVALLYGLAVLDPAGRRVDNHLLGAAAHAGAGFEDMLRTVLDVAAPAATMLAGWLVVRAWRAGQRDRAVTVGVVVVGSQALAQLLKLLLPTAHGANSFPSGHVTVAVTTIVAVVLLVPRLARAALALAVPIVAATGLGTMLVDWHRPSDILAAVGVVAIVSGVTVAVWAPAGALLPGPSRPRFG